MLSRDDQLEAARELRGLAILQDGTAANGRAARLRALADGLEAEPAPSEVEPLTTLWQCPDCGSFDLDRTRCESLPDHDRRRAAVPVFSGRDMQAVQERAEKAEEALALETDNCELAREQVVEFSLKLGVAQTMIDAALLTTWERDEDGGWGTAEDTLHPDRFVALTSLQPHWQAWGDSAWTAAGLAEERARKSEAREVELAEALRDLVDAARNFSTAANYKIEVGDEEDFVVALAEAEALLDGEGVERTHTLVPNEHCLNAGYGLRKLVERGDFNIADQRVLALAAALEAERRGVEPEVARHRRRCVMSRTKRQERGIGCHCGWPLDSCHPPLGKGTCDKDRHEQETHPALVRAREVATYPVADRLRVAGPHALWVLANGEREIYIQAMEIAGYLVPSDDDASRPDTEGSGS